MPSCLRQFDTQDVSLAACYQKPGEAEEDESKCMSVISERNSGGSIEKTTYLACAATFYNLLKPYQVFPRNIVGVTADFPNN